MFKDSFKYYKSKNPSPSLDKILDFEKLTDLNRVQQVYIKDDKTKPFFGFKPLEKWKVYEIVDKPGLLFINNPFTCIGQRYWSVRCLQDYSKKPQKSNMDPLHLIPQNEDWWDMCQNDNNCVLMNKLRWITLGYHHNWDTKAYSEDSKGELPTDLKDMSAFVGNVIGYVNFIAEAAIVNYYHIDSTLSGHTDHSENNLEAPIFSFSFVKDIKSQKYTKLFNASSKGIEALSYRSHCSKDIWKPNFGQTAIFLIGGQTKEEPALPIFIRSGDIIVMSKESRLCYHGVPKILQTDSRYWDPVEEFESSAPKEYKKVIEICKNDVDWKPFGNYLTHSRINLNVRQVLKMGQKGLNDNQIRSKNDHIT